MSKEDGPSPTPVLEVHTPNDEKLIVHEDGSIIENDKIATGATQQLANMNVTATQSATAMDIDVGTQHILNADAPAGTSTTPANSISANDAINSTSNSC